MTSRTIPTIAVVAMATLTVTSLAAWGGGSKAAPRPQIQISHTPSDPPGEAIVSSEISGTVANAPKGARVIIYAQGDAWYVQPFVNAPYTSISGGRWHTETHGGYAFRALLVTSRYQPAATTGEPPGVGGGVLAIANAGPGK